MPNNRSTARERNPLAGEPDVLSVGVLMSGGNITLETAVLNKGVATERHPTDYKRRPEISLLLLGFFLLRVNPLVVSLKSRGIRIIVLLTQCARLVVKRFGKIESPATFIRFSKTVINVR